LTLFSRTKSLTALALNSAKLSVTLRLSYLLTDSVHPSKMLIL
jgi:hypothetical protein